MGVLNVTPDSFSGDGLHGRLDAVVERAERLVDEGADLLDVGGESTRRGYTPVDTEEELHRVIPALRALAPRIRIPISVDTSKAEVARAALAEGAVIVNDVSGLRDPDLLPVVQASAAGLVLVHNGVPPADKSPMAAILTDLRRLVDACVTSGVPAERLAVDPGLGMGGKDWRTNFPIMRDLSDLTSLGCPVLVGASRKGMIARVLGPGLENRLDGSLALAALCVARGARVVRVHDVAETRQVVRMLDAIQSGWDSSAPVA